MTTSDCSGFVGPLPQKRGRGRPRKHENAAARQKAFRASNTVATVRLDGKIAPTVALLSEQFEVDQTHVINNLLRFALANRDWRKMGLGGWAMKDERFTKGKRALVERDTSLDSFSLA